MGEWKICIVILLIAFLLLGMLCYEDDQRRASYATMVPDTVTLNDGSVVRGYYNGMTTEQGKALCLQDSPDLIAGDITHTIPVANIKIITKNSPR